MRRLTILFIALSCLAAPYVNGQKSTKPNIIFIFTDDLAYQAISAYGHGLNQTPNIDRIAKGGMLFDRCVVTNSICGPSRATILTGKYSHMNGFYRNERGDFDGSQQTFPKLFQQAGYQTAIIGKWHLGSAPTGFDHWEVMVNQGSYYNADFLSKDGKTIAPGYSTDVVREKSIDWLDKQRDKSKPFLLMMQFKAPHREWEPGPDHMNMYDDHVFPEPPTLFDNYEGRASAARNQKMSIAKDMVLEGDNKLYNEESRKNFKGRSYARMTDEEKRKWDSAYDPKNKIFYDNKLTGDDLTRWKYQRYMQDYMATVASVDDNVGRLLDYLDKMHLTENTLVVFASDQGFYLGEHGWFDKRWMYEESFRTPLLIRWPGKLKPGSINRDIVSNLDFAETLLDVAGIPVPADMQGKSMVPILKGKTPAGWRKSFYYHYYEGGVHGVPEHEGVYMDSLKLIHYYTLGEWEMFDLRRDPYEMHSVYNNPEYASRQKRLEQELEALRKDLKVPVARSAATQKDIELVKSMPNAPTPYQMKDWKEVAAKQDKLLYDFNAKGTWLPLIWWDDNKVNFPIRAIGMPSYVGSSKQETKASSYESLPVMGSILGASLIGIDKSNQDGNDYVSMCKQFFNKKNGVNLVMNNVDRKPGRTFWYEIWPGMAFNMIVDLYPANKELADLMKINAENWIKAIDGLAKDRAYPDFNYTSYDFDAGRGVYNNRWKEPDAAAGLAWLEFSAWKKFKDDKFLKAAKQCMAFLQDRPAKDGPYYEIMMPYGAYLAVRMNAELGTDYDELKMLNWCFDGNNTDRKGWGVIAERWGDYDVYGLVGQKQWEQYGFAMNTFTQAAALVPIVKYNPVYARTIGKWILNLASASRLFYADAHPLNRQTSGYWKADSDHVISYEGVRKNLDNGNGFHVFKGVLAAAGPYAVGDQVKSLKSRTDICLYGSVWVGMLAALVDTTNVEKIIRIDCNATDFFGDRSVPTYLYYNPFTETKKVQLDLGQSAMDIYDMVNKEMVKTNVKNKTVLEIPGNEAVVIRLTPTKTK